MRLPSWHEFNEKINELDKKVAEKVGTFKKDHTALDRLLTASLSFLPPPFGAIATNLYKAYPASLPPQQKADGVLNYFKEIQSRGEEHYDKIATKLDALLVDVTDLKQLTAKESTLETVREILIANNTLVDSKLDYLRNELGQIGQTVHKIDTSTEVINQKITKVLQLVELQMEEYDRLNIPLAIEKEKKMKIPQDMKNELEVRGKEIERLKVELERGGEPIKLSNEYLLREGNTFYDSGNYEKALEYYDQILKDEPKDVNALYNKGHALYNLSRNLEAISCFDKILEIDPKNVNASMMKGNVLSTLGKFEEAIPCWAKAHQETISCCDKTLEIDPKNVNALHQKSSALYYLKRYQEEISCYDKILEIDPKSVDALYSKGLALCHLGRCEEAISYVDKILEIDPKDTFAPILKGLVLDRLGR